MTLAEKVLKTCKLKGWGLDWSRRGCYLHLEASELIESIRGKRGDPASEAADILFCLMSITEGAGIEWKEVLQRLKCLVDRLSLTCGEIVLCQDCLRLMPFSMRRHNGEEFCECGGELCGCQSCVRAAKQLLDGETPATLRKPIDVSKWTPEKGVNSKQ